ncbi:hypothetical protein [Lysobacter sp. FW306-1B-D06B]|uniref:hypothetical protein n=1 Tax=Lysobacter sp. FW306-1B-D06B TaxID=3140250 RepID=UPI0031404C2D
MPQIWRELLAVAVFAGAGCSAAVASLRMLDIDGVSYLTLAFVVFASWSCALICAVSASVLVALLLMSCVKKAWNFWSSILTRLALVAIHSGAVRPGQPDTDGAGR